MGWGDGEGREREGGEGEDQRQGEGEECELAGDVFDFDFDSGHRRGGAENSRGRRGNCGACKLDTVRSLTGRRVVVGSVLVARRVVHPISFRKN